MITQGKYTITEREHTGKEDVLLDLEGLREHTMGDITLKNLGGWSEHTKEGFTLRSGGYKVTH